MSDSSQVWTKALVQEHARAAVAVELYTLPFYLTALASITDTNHPHYQILYTVCLEEMLHVQLAANLCLALDTQPQFTAPDYSADVPFLKPNDPATGHDQLIHAEIGPMDATRLGTMLDIETPEEVQPNPTHKTTPDYPYDSIQELYDALLAGIEQVGVDQFGWNRAYQQQLWVEEQPFSQLVESYAAAQQVVKVIVEQGEGSSVASKPSSSLVLADVAPLNSDYYDNKAAQGDHLQKVVLDPTQFPLAPEYRLASSFTYPAWCNLSHYGRFLLIQNDLMRQGFDPDSGEGHALFAEVYPRAEVSQDHPTNVALQQAFAATLSNMNQLWSGQTGTIMSMIQLLRLAQVCWKNHITPVWTPPAA
uniref:Iminophenyl-pyruvate dimer synthase domain-containing protein n=1 Tax=Magnetococcus massalia (strain MO-1) TaxID=451514 RepID=A0A1S7LIQ1_MAGMO|nr:Protein of unknown function [Candidatus Magnetococcus massalia]